LGRAPDRAARYSLRVREARFHSSDGRALARQLAIAGGASIAIAIGSAGCGDRDRAEREAASEAGALSPSAHPEMAAELLADLEAPRHAGDGGGRAWIESLERLVVDRRESAVEATFEPASSVVVASRARVRIGFEVGPHGIAEGGAIYLQSSPFWDWEPAQTDVPDLGGYASASTSAPGVELAPRTYAGGLVAFTVGGRALAQGERVEIAYGAGPTGVVVDRYAERESPIWLHVDADGDGTRAVVASSPAVAVRAGPPALLVVRTPTTARPGEAVDVHLALLDALGNAGVDVDAELEFESQDLLALPARVEILARDGGVARVAARVERAGLARLRARARFAGEGDRERAPIEGESEPLLALPSAPRVLWADLHGHSAISDGTGTPEDYFRYARDVAALDVAALTDHDHWGMRFLDANPDLWKRIRDAANEANEPGRFVALLGYEWTSWLHGHRHVLHFADDGPLHSSITRDRATETPTQLWASLRGLPALTFAHHSAGGPIATNWSYAPDPELEPVTEIVSVHGSSEAPDSPRPIYSPVAGNSVRDALARGYTLGFVGSGDSHDGHPGLAQLASAARTSGVAAIFAEERTRESVLEALRARRTYATNGPRIYLRATLDGVHEMGARVDAGANAAHVLAIRVAAQAPLAHVDVIRNGEIAMRLDGEGALEWSREGEIPRLEAGETLYVRAIQQNDGAAWSSPFFGPVAVGAASRAPSE